MRHTPPVLTSSQLFSYLRLSLHDNNPVRVKNQSGTSIHTQKRACAHSAQSHKVRISSFSSFFMHFLSSFLSSFPMSLYFPLPKRISSGKKKQNNRTEVHVYHNRNTTMNREEEHSRQLNEKTKSNCKQLKNLKKPFKNADEADYC